MKHPYLILLFLYITSQYAAGAIVMPTAAPVSDDTMMSAIADVETGNNPAQRGQRGERTRLQILPATWRRFSRLPHASAATNPTETDRVARAYLAEIRQHLRARGLPETPFFIAAGWNAGAGWRHLSRGTTAYAERVANVVQDLQPKDLPPRAILPPDAIVPVELALKQAPLLTSKGPPVPLIQIAVN